MVALWIATIILINTSNWIYGLITSILIFPLLFTKKIRRSYSGGLPLIVVMLISFFLAPFSLIFDFVRISKARKNDE